MHGNVSTRGFEPFEGEIRVVRRSKDRTEMAAVPEMAEMAAVPEMAEMAANGTAQDHDASSVAHLHYQAIAKHCTQG